MTGDQLPLIAHVINRLGVGGLENGLINLINHVPDSRYRHAIICLTESSKYAERIRDKKVRIISLDKQPGHDWGVHRRFLRILRDLKPQIVHTRNLPAMEFQLMAAVAGIPGRIHGEHGRDIYDLDGRSAKYNLIRTAIRPFIKHYTAVSLNLAQWLVNTVGVKPNRVSQIYNGVDTDRYRPAQRGREPIGPEGFATKGTFVIGTVGRMEPVKDQISLVRAFIHLASKSQQLRESLRLVLIGEGTLRQPALELLGAAGLAHNAWLPGERDDVPDLMKGLDLFVLPSLREGISNTILEAMATGLPVVATDVGGNPELIDRQITGSLVPHSSPLEMAEEIRRYVENPSMGFRQGKAGRGRVQTQFSMEAMVDGYLHVYDSTLKMKDSPVRAPVPVS